MSYAYWMRYINGCSSAALSRPLRDSESVKNISINDAVVLTGNVLLYPIRTMTQRIQIAQIMEAATGMKYTVPGDNVSGIHLNCFQVYIGFADAAKIQSVEAVEFTCPDNFIAHNINYLNKTTNDVQRTPQSNERTDLSGRIAIKMPESKIAVKGKVGGNQLRINGGAIKIK